MYRYAVINDAGKCYEIYNTNNYTCDEHHVPVDDINIDYLGKYYHPIAKYVDGEFDFIGNWYLDFEHEIKVKEVAR